MPEQTPAAPGVPEQIPVAPAAPEQTPAASVVPAPPAPAQILAAPGGRKDGTVVLERNLVTVTVTVQDVYGRYVTGLDRSHFEVFDDKVKQEITFFDQQDAPITLGVLYDVSGSMESRIRRSMYSLRRFVETSHVEDEFFLVGFNQRPSLVRDFSPSGQSVVNSLGMIKPDGRTALYDAIYLGVEKAKQGRHHKRALLIISDGQDNSSRYSFGELRNLLKESDVQLYAIGVVDLARDRDLGPYGLAVLEEVTRITGGRAFFPKSDGELVDVCTQIALELRHQYSVGYYPTTDVRDGRWHKIRVKLNPPPGLPRLSFRSKEGYYGLKR